MPVATIFPNAPDISADDYCVFGLATCFFKEDGVVQELQIIEPIPSSALETLIKGIPTSYKIAYATSLKDVFVNGSFIAPSEFPPEAQVCQDLVERTQAAVRTYKRRTQAQEILPLGTSRQDFNYSLDKKRVLNATNVVKAEDNVKQHSHTHQVL